MSNEVAVTFPQVAIEADIPSPVGKLLKESSALEQAGEFGAALRLAQQAREHATAQDESEMIAAALIREGYIHFRQGRYEKAHSLGAKALEHASTETPVRARVLILLGSCAAEHKGPSVAEDYYHQAIDLSRQLGYARGLLRGLHSLSAGVYVPTGRFELALAADQEALRLAVNGNMPELAWFPLSVMGWVFWATGRSSQARATVKEWQRYALPGSRAEGYYFCLCGDLALDDGDSAQALAFYTQTRSIAEVVGDPGLEVLLRLGLSRLYRFEDSSVARSWANDAVGIARRVEYNHMQGKALIERGLATWSLGDPEGAEADLRAAFDLLMPVEAAFDLARAALLLAALAHEQGSAEVDSLWGNAARRIIDGGYEFLLEQQRAVVFPLMVEQLNTADRHLTALTRKLLELLKKVPPSPLRIHSLGAFQVWQGNRPIQNTALSQRRAGELFRCLLVSRNRSKTRDQVLEALWPEKSPGAARAAFHQATSALRRALEPDLPDKFPSRYLSVDQGQVVLQLPEGSWVDFEAFEKHIADEAWEEALACYRGDLFPGDLYADWAAAPR